MTRWLVVTPEYETHSADQINPPEYGCDVAEVEAENRRDAAVFGIRLIRQQSRRRNYFTWAERNPFAGLKVFPADNVFVGEEMSDDD